MAAETLNPDMKIHSKILGVVATGFVAGLGASQPAAAQVTEEKFNALEKTVRDLADKVQKLEHVHDEDVKTHQQDLQQIQQLTRQGGETRKAAPELQPNPPAAPAIEPVHPIPPGTDLNATHNFTMAGDAEIQFGKVDGQHGGFALADFAPIFLFRARDNILFEAGFDINLQNNAPGSAGATTSLNLSFAQLDYLFSDYGTLVAGDMLLPLGTYSERSAGWLNKIPDAPLARAFLPGSGVGAQLRGAVPIGGTGQSITYAVYGANGPGSVDGSGHHDQLDLNGNVGIKSNGTFGNLHGSPSGGGRMGWFLPWKPHYDLELGLSGQTGDWDSAGGRRWSAAVADAALHLGPYLEVKGEYIHSWVETDDVGTIQPDGWWLQAGYKMAGLKQEIPFLRKLELMGRYDRAKDGLAARTERFTLGYVYYITNTLLFEGDYEFLRSTDPDQRHNELLFQLSYGF